MKQSLGLILLGLAVFLGFRFVRSEEKSSSVPYYNSPDLTPSWVANKDDLATTVPHQIGEFSMLDQTGSTITRASIEGKIHVADFFFTSCSSVCPMMSHQFKLLQDSLLRDANVELLSFSVTPWIDSVPRLRGYGETIGAQPTKWHLLTGEKSAIYDLARKSYFAEGSAGYSKDSGQFLHTEHFVLVDQTLRIRGVYNGTLALERERLLADIRSIEAE